MSISEGDCACAGLCFFFAGVFFFLGIYEATQNDFAFIHYCICSVLFVLAISKFVSNKD